MEGMAKARFVRSTPQKSRRVVNMIRGKNALEAYDILRFAPQASQLMFARCFAAQCTTPPLKQIGPAGKIRLRN